MGLKILITSDHYPPFIGGAHRQTQLLSQELQKRGHQVNVATVWQPGLADRQEEEGGLIVYRLKQVRVWLPGFSRVGRQLHQPPFPDPITVFALRRLINRFKPDIVHSYGWISYSSAVALLGKTIPLLVSARDYGYSCATRSLLFKDKTCGGPALTKCLSCASEFYGTSKGTAAVLGVFLSQPLLLKKINGFHSVSRFVQTVMERDLTLGNDLQSNVRERSIIKKVIPSFLIDTDQQTNASKFLKRLPDESFILYVGGLQHRKGVGFLLEAYEKLVSPPPLVLIGYSAGEAQMTFPSGVTVLKDVPHADVMTAWRRSLFGVIPSLWPDPSPGVIREGMSQGKAMIVTDVGGSTEMICDDVTGLVVPPGEVNALSDAMSRLIADADLRERLGQAVKEASALYMADVVVPQFEHLYHQMLLNSRILEDGKNTFAE